MMSDRVELMNAAVRDSGEVRTSPGVGINLQKHDFIVH